MNVGTTTSGDEDSAPVFAPSDAIISILQALLDLLEGIIKEKKKDPFSHIPPLPPEMPPPTKPVIEFKVVIWPPPPSITGDDRPGKEWGAGFGIQINF